MQHERLSSADAFASLLRMQHGVAEEALAFGAYHFELIRDGVVIDAWDETNLVTTQGRNFILDTVLGGSAYTAALNLSLYTAGTAAAAATYASPGVTECTNLASRPSVTFGAAASGTKTSNNVTCTFTGAQTITGVMMVKGSSTLGDTAAAGGVMLSQAALGTQRPVISGDQLVITYSLTV